MLQEKINDYIKEMSDILTPVLSVCDNMERFFSVIYDTI